MWRWPSRDRRLPARTTSAALWALVPDRHGTAQLAIQNSTSAVTRTYTDPYGNPRGTAPTAFAGDHGFLDKPEDTTGLTAIGARYYDPVIARFISVDPVMDLTDPQQWNAYAYANGNPITWSDPTGLWLFWPDIAASAVSTAWNATTTWVDEHQADIVAGVTGIVVGGGCLLVTGLAGSVACGALGGAAAAAASHAWRAQVQHTEEFSWGTLGRDALIGGATGALTAGIGNKLGIGEKIRPFMSRAGNTITSFFRRPKVGLSPVAANTAARGGVGPVRVGQAGEAAVRSAYDIGPKATVEIGGRTRILDGLNARAVSEVKNVGYQAYTQQLRDSLAYAQQNGLRFDLYVRGGANPTTLSRPLQEAIASNPRFNLEFIP